MKAALMLPWRSLKRYAMLFLFGSKSVRKDSFFATSLIVFMLLNIPLFVFLYFLQSAEMTASELAGNAADLKSDDDKKDE